jgi:hypothetical protein
MEGQAPWIHGYPETMGHECFGIVVAEINCIGS